MELTEEFRTRVDTATLEELLRGWRHAPIGHPDFQGERGRYWSDRLFSLRDADQDAWVRASKIVGWD